jgi:hypothetical protein
MRRRLLLGVLLIAAITAPRPAQAINVKNLLLMTSYGVMVGTLTGIASLAFYDSPSQHYRNVAFGASLGLYTGIGIWTYLSYFAADVKKQEEEEKKPKVNPDDPINLEGSLPRFLPTATLTPNGSALLGFNYSF